VSFAAITLCVASQRVIVIVVVVVYFVINSVRKLLDTPSCSLHAHIDRNVLNIELIHTHRVLPGSGFQFRCCMEENSKICSILHPLHWRASLREVTL
jgi:hypothetical protein